MGMKYPSLAVTMGDPYGIGAEVLSELLKHSCEFPNTSIIAIGSGKILRSVYSSSELPEHVEEIHTPPSNVPDPGTLVLYDPTPLPLNPDQRGQGTESSGQAALSYLKNAVQLCRDQICNGIVTGPVSKKWISPAIDEDRWSNPPPDEQLTGQTEWFANEFQSTSPVMGMKHDTGLVTLVTRHIPIHSISSFLTKDTIEHTIRTTCETLEKGGIQTPRIGVCGLNPHAGENGLLGNEEQTRIQPAVESCKQDSMTVEGPFSAETLLSDPEFQTYDAVIAMYHDQGLVPIKTRGLLDCAGVTLNLPVIRTSVSHGTAYALVNSNEYSHSSLFKAVQFASKLRS